MIANVSILLLCSLCIAYVGLNAYAAILADYLIFPTPASSYQDDATILKLQTSDGETISAYYLPAGGDKKLLIYSHGNGEDIGDVRPLLEQFTRHGVSALAYEYHGYGTSSGNPSEDGCYAAIEAAYAYATQTLGYRSDQITLYGRSLGSGPSSWLAEREAVAGLILDGAFTSTFRVLTHVKMLPWDKFDNYALLPQIQSPVLDSRHGGPHRPLQSCTEKLGRDRRIQTPLLRRRRRPRQPHRTGGSDVLGHRYPFSKRRP